MKKNTILQEKENRLFNRKEIEIVFETNVTPKILEAENFVAQEFSSVPENIKIKKIKGKFGSKDFVISANIYSSKEDKEKTEPKSKKEKQAENKGEAQAA